MTESPRIQELRRRVHQDPASLAFAPLAEELRRAGQVDESVTVCQAGLTHHPEYVSARATLGRALLELGRADEALEELKTVLSAAPDNLSALKTAAEIYHRRGETTEALATYRTALTLVRQDADLERLIAELEQSSPQPVLVKVALPATAVAAPAVPPWATALLTPAEVQAPAPAVSEAAIAIDPEVEPVAPAIAHAPQPIGVPELPPDPNRVAIHRLERFLDLVDGDRLRQRSNQ